MRMRQGYRTMKYPDKNPMSGGEVVGMMIVLAICSLFPFLYLVVIGIIVHGAEQSKNKKGKR